MLDLDIRQLLVSGRIGGAEKIALQLNSFVNQQRPGASALVLPSGSEAERHARAAGLEYRGYSLTRLGSRNRLESWLENLRLRRQLSVGGGRKIVHIHNPFVYGAMRPALMASRLATVLHLHLDYTVAELQWPLRNPPDMVILCAEFMRQPVETVLADSASRDTQIVVVRNAVDTGRFHPQDQAAVRAELGFATQRPLLLMVANLAEHKGQLTAIRAVAHLRRRGLDPMLWLAGEDRDSVGYAELLQRAVDELGLQENVRLLGFRDDIPRLLAASDAFLLPSVREGLPLSILEAQASRVVVLAAPTAGIPEVIRHGETGFLLGAQDDRAYADVLETLLGNAALRAEVTDAAYRQVLATAELTGYCTAVTAAYAKLS